MVRDAETPDAATSLEPEPGVHEIPVTGGLQAIESTPRKTVESNLSLETDSHIDSYLSEMDQVRSELLSTAESQPRLEPASEAGAPDSGKQSFHDESSKALQACLAVAQKYFHLGFLVGLRFTADIRDDVDSEEEDSENSVDYGKNASTRTCPKICRCSGLRKASSWPNFPADTSPWIQIEPEKPVSSSQAPE